MNYLGIDYGEKRIGLAGGDDDVGVATPLAASTAPTESARLEQIGEVIARRRVEALVIGYPLHMNGEVSATARAVDAFVAKLETRFGLPVHRLDERLTSHQAGLSVPGVKAKRGSPRQQRAARQTGELDSRAAAIILQDYLDARAFGSANTCCGGE